MCWCYTLNTMDKLVYNKSKSENHQYKVKTYELSYIMKLSSLKYKKS